MGTTPTKDPCPDQKGCNSLQPLKHDTPNVPSTVKPDPASEPDPQLRLALYWDAVDLSRPDKALWRELLDLFYCGDGIARAIAWELWSFADHRTGAVPEHVTPRTLAESTGWNVKKTIRTKLADMARKGVVRRTRPQNKRQSFRYEMNLGGRWKRRRQRTPTVENSPIQQLGIEATHTGRLGDSLSVSMPPSGATKPHSMPPSGATKPHSIPPSGATKPHSMPPSGATKPHSMPPSEATKPHSMPPSEATKPHSMPPSEATKPHSMPPSEATKPHSMPPSGATIGEYVREKKDQGDLAAVADRSQQICETTDQQQQQQDRQLRRKEGLIAWVMTNCRHYEITIEDADTNTDIAYHELEDTVATWPLVRLQSLADDMKNIIAEKKRRRRSRL